MWMWMWMNEWVNEWSMSTNVNVCICEDTFRHIRVVAVVVVVFHCRSFGCCQIALIVSNRNTICALNLKLYIVTYWSRWWCSSILFAHENTQALTISIQQFWKHINCDLFGFHLGVHCVSQWCLMFARPNTYTFTIGGKWFGARHSSINWLHVRL